MGNQNDNIYSYFRCNNSSPKRLTGKIEKPTGDKNESIKIIREGNHISMVRESDFLEAYRQA